MSASNQQPDCLDDCSDEFISRFMAYRKELEEKTSDLLKCFLRDKGIPVDSESFEVPKEFLMEISALLQIREWEERGLLDDNPPDLPSFMEAGKAFAMRVRKGPGEFSNEAYSELAIQADIFWYQNIAWDGQEYLGQEFRIGEFDEEELFDEIAQLLWDNRNLTLTIDTEGEEV